MIIIQGSHVTTGITRFGRRQLTKRIVSIALQTCEKSSTVPVSVYEVEIDLFEEEKKDITYEATDLSLKLLQSSSL